MGDSKSNQIMSKLVLTRISVDFLLLLGLLFSPWWLVLILVIASALFFRDFYEVVFIGFGFDLLYGPGTGFSVSWQNFAGLISGGAIFLLALLLKTRLIVYNR